MKSVGGLWVGLTVLANDYSATFLVMGCTLLTEEDLVEQMPDIIPDTTNSKGVAATRRLLIQNIKV